MTSIACYARHLQQVLPYAFLTHWWWLAALLMDGVLSEGSLNCSWVAWDFKKLCCIRALVYSSPEMDPMLCVYFILLSRQQLTKVF